MGKLHEITVSIPQTSNDDPRVGHLLGSGLEEDESPAAVIIGFPSDEGVRRNKGRPGASGAPDEIRHELFKMTPSAEEHEKMKDLLAKTADLGNLAVTVDLESAQGEMGSLLSPYLADGVVPIILGGGHETAFAHFLGYAESGLSTAIFNLDAHADVRPLREGKAHSGSPFRQAIEHESQCCNKYLVAGLQPHSLATSHLEYIESSGGRYLLKEETNITSISGLFHEHDSERLMVTFDMDAVDQSFAPGVSAPCANGIHPDLWLTAAYLAGRNEKVGSFDISEMNPAFDSDKRTARLAALTVWHFLLGLSQR